MYSSKRRVPSSLCSIHDRIGKGKTSAPFPECSQTVLPLIFCSFFSNLPSRRLMGKLITNVDAVLANLEKHIAPIVEERLEQERIHGPNWTDEPVRPLFVSLRYILCLKFAPAYRTISSPGCSKELKKRKKNSLPEIWPDV